MCHVAGARVPRACFTGTSGEHMADYQPSREILNQLLERIELLERVLGMTTARLHAIEQHLGIIRQPQPLPESVAGQSGEAHPVKPQIKTEDVKASAPPQPP